MRSRFFHHGPAFQTQSYSGRGIGVDLGSVVWGVCAAGRRSRGVVRIPIGVEVHVSKCACSRRLHRKRRVFLGCSSEGGREPRENDTVN